ncbi:unnamed protein product, partial [Nesidiocoris tenuis]
MVGICSTILRNPFAPFKTQCIDLYLRVKCASSSRNTIGYHKSYHTNPTHFGGQSRSRDGRGDGTELKTFIFGPSIHRVDTVLTKKHFSGKHPRKSFYRPFKILQRPGSYATNSSAVNTWIPSDAIAPFDTEDENKLIKIRA